MWVGSKKENFCIRQHDEYDCGAASLCSIAAWYGLQVPLLRVRRLCGCSRDGITIQGIVDAAKVLKFDAKAFKSPGKDIEELASLNEPFIAHLQRDDGYLHYVVVLEISHTRVTIMEPALGEVESFTLSRFIGQWSGYLITITPGKNFKKAELKSSKRERIRRLLALDNTSLRVPLLLSFLTIIAGAANSFILQRLIDVTIPSGRVMELIIISIIVAVVTLAVMAMGQIRGTMLLKGAVKIDTQLIKEFIHKIYSMPAEIFNQFSAGDLNSRIGDVYKIRVFILEGLVAVPLCCATLLIVLILMFWTNSRLAVLSLLFFPLYTVISLVSVKLYKKHNRELARLSARFESSLLHGMETLITVKHFGTEESAIRRIETRHNALQKEVLAAGKSSTGMETIGDGLSRMLLASTLIIGGFSVTGGELTTGELVSFYTLVSLFAAPLDTLTSMANLFSQASVSMERLFEILECEDEERGDSGLSAKGAKQGDLLIDNICFSYPGRKRLFDNLSTMIKANSITLIKGSNGSGKSTLASLIMRDLVPDSGRIEINGEEISSIPLNQWRACVSLIPAHPVIFDDTLLANITCGVENPDIEAASKAAVEAGLDGIIKELPAGICTNIGRGNLLSGGQLQKIAVARALYKDPQIFIFDEATANMDQMCEKSIMGVMARLKRRGKTVVVISHSGAMNSIADNCIYLG